MHSNIRTTGRKEDCKIQRVISFGRSAQVVDRKRHGITSLNFSLWKFMASFSELFRKGYFYVLWRMEQPILIFCV